MSGPGEAIGWGADEKTGREAPRFHGLSERSYLTRIIFFRSLKFGASSL